MKAHRIKALLLKNFYVSINSIDRIIDIFYWPFIDILIWGFTGYYLQNSLEINLLPVFLVGVTLRIFESRGAQDIPLFVLEDYWSNNLYNLFSSPLKISELISSILITSTLRAFISFFVITAFTWSTYSFTILQFPIHLIIISILLLIIFGWSVGLFITALIVRYGQRVQIIAWSLVWLFQPFSCTFYPIHILPEWAKVIASCIPATYIYENLRNYAAARPINYAQLGLATMIVMIIFLISCCFLTSSFAYAKKQGLLARKG